MPKAAYRSDIRENTNFCPQRDANLGPLAPQASVLPLDHCDLHYMCPPNSPDINPMDYAIWGALQQRVYHQRQFKSLELSLVVENDNSRNKTVEELKRAIVTEWQKLSQHFIDNSINDWRRRLEAVIKDISGHIEHCNLA